MCITDNADKIFYLKPANKSINLNLTFLYISVQINVIQITVLPCYNIPLHFNAGFLMTTLWKDRIEKKKLSVVTCTQGRVEVLGVFRLRKSSTQLNFIKTVRTGVVLCWLKDLWQCPKAKAWNAQRTTKCVRVNWMTQSISIKDFEAHDPPCVCRNWNQLQMVLPVGFL